jgi:formate dehydrogenase maturation protein FdhE
MAEDFVDMCPVCNKGVPKASMVYQKGKVFHPQ